MLEHVGDDNIVIFGLTAEEVAERAPTATSRATSSRPRRSCREALSAISSGVFSPDDPNRYRDLLNGIYDHDWFMVAADFDAYAAAQRKVDAIWRDSPNWNAMAIRNIARMGWFSSDRTIRQYATEIWNVPHE